MNEILDIGKAILLAGIWIGCGIYAYGMKKSDALLGALFLTVIIL